jgi:hypothetical protein
MKHRVVVFTRNNARIITTSDISKYKNRMNISIDPDLSKVQGTPPHFWKLHGRKIVPLTRPEKLARLQDIKVNGLDNRLQDGTGRPVRLPRVSNGVEECIMVIAALAVAFALGVIIG